MRLFLILFLIHGFLCAAGTSTQAKEQSPSPEHLEFFEREVRPLLATHCYECHSTQAKRVEANLLLDSRSSHLQGGDSGAAVIPGDASASLLIEAVHYDSYEMPPKGKLSDEDIHPLGRSRCSLAKRTSSYQGDCAGIRSGKQKSQFLGMAANANS